MEHSRDVFISHHSDSSKAVVEKLCHMLEERGISCWYAPRDVSGSYANAIETAIESCRIFLLLLNENSNISAHVLNEVNSAFERFRQEDTITLLPFRLKPCGLSKDMHYYIGRMHIMDGTNPPEELRLQELVERIAAMLEPVFQTPSKDSRLYTDDGKKYALSSSRPRYDNLFIGREKEVEQTINVLANSGGKAVLTGMGGIGKSEIAKKVIWHSSHHYSTIMWISFQESLQKTIINDYAFPITGFSRDDYPNDDDRAYFERKLRLFKEIAGEQVLVVVDNFDVSGDEDLETFCEGEFHILFTSRFRQISNHLPEIEVHKFDDQKQLLQLFQSIYTRTLDQSAVRFVQKIIEELDGHTLGIRLVASGMRDHRISPEKMFQILHSNGDSSDVRGSRAMQSIHTKLEQLYRISALSSKEVFILKNLALIPLSGVQVETFFDWCRLSDFAEIDSLIQKSWIIHDPICDSIHLHPLITDLILPLIQKDDSCCSSLVSAVSDICLSAYETPYSRKQELYTYLSCFRKQLSCESSLLPTLLMSFGLITNMLGKYEESIEIYEDMLKTEPSVSKQIIGYSRLAHSYVQAEKFQECWNCIQKGLDFLSGLPEQELTAPVQRAGNWLLQRACECARKFNKLEKAIEYGQKALAILEDKTSETVSWDTGWSKYHLAYALLLSGNPREGEAHLQDARLLFSQSNNAYSCAYCTELLGQARMLQGDYQQAIELTKEAGAVLCIRPEVREESIGRNELSLGNIYRMAGDNTTACAHYTKAMEAFSKYSETTANKVQNIINSTDILLNL